MSKTIMDRKVRIYIPSIYKRAIKSTMKHLAKKFGGTTNYIIEGTRLNDKEELIKENIEVIEAWYKEKQHLFVLAHMIDLALDVKEACKQDYVALEFDGEMYIV